MKLTITIPDRHAGDLLQFIASLKGETIVDPAPGHPELPLSGDNDRRLPIDIQPNRRYKCRNGCIGNITIIDGRLMFSDSSMPARIHYASSGIAMSSSFASREWDIVEEIVDEHSSRR